jgi:8-oxo-dGTP pyrophosphatase MutT (NUDIX family)
LRQREGSVECLLMRHPGRYDLPKGHQQAGESDLQTALRELAEETGLQAEQITLWPVFRYEETYSVPYTRFAGAMVEKTIVIFAAWLAQDSPIQTSEHASYEWVALTPNPTRQTQTINPLLMQLHHTLSAAS